MYNDNILIALIVQNLVIEGYSFSMAANTPDVIEITDKNGSYYCFKNTDFKKWLLEKKGIL